MTDSRLAMSTWVGTLAKTGLIDAEHEEAGLTVAAFVVGEENLERLRRDLAKLPPDAIAREKKGAIEVCVWMAKADRKLDPEESHMLSRLIMSSGLDADTQDALVESIHHAPEPVGIEERVTHPVLRELLLSLSWEMAQADGDVAEAEEALYMAMAGRFEISPERAAELRDAVTERLA